MSAREADFDFLCAPSAPRIGDEHSSPLGTMVRNVGFICRRRWVHKVHGFWSKCERDLIHLERKVLSSRGEESKALTGFWS